MTDYRNTQTMENMNFSSDWSKYSGQPGMVNIALFEARTGFLCVGSPVNCLE